MSGFIGLARPTQTIEASDPDGEMSPISFRLPETVWERKDDFGTPWWPGGGGVGDLIRSIWFEQPERPFGSSTRWGVVGITRDQYGAVLGGVTVKLFRTADDTKQDETVSDASGNFTVTTPFYEGFYLVFYKAGAPDVSGTTVNTLIPAS